VREIKGRSCGFREKKTRLGFFMVVLVLSLATHTEVAG
jgi:hypothetical protein